MNTPLSKRFVATAAVALAALGAVSVAQARSDISWSIGIGSPGVYVEPQPVYVQPQPVYVQPQPVYVQPQPVYVQPRPYYVQPAPVYLPPQVIYSQPPAYGYYYNGPGWRRAHWERQQGWLHNRYGRDNDRDWNHGGR